MIKDKKGIGGFMEAITALMVIIVALTAFLGLLAYSDLGELSKTPTIDTEFIEDLELKDGIITGETAGHLGRYVEKNNLNGARLEVIVAGNLCDASLTDSVGEQDGDNVGTVKGTFPIRSDDGRSFVASYEVVCWWD